MERKSAKTGNVKKITIDTEFIPAVSLLKLAGVVESGGQASYEIEQGRVTMDGVLLTEKRKKVRPGSTVVLDNRFAIYVSRKE